MRVSAGLSGGRSGRRYEENVEVGPRRDRAYGLGGGGGAMYNNLQIIARELWRGGSGTEIVCWVKDIAGVMC